MSIRGAAVKAAHKLTSDQLRSAEDIYRDPDWKWLSHAFYQAYRRETSTGEIGALYRLYAMWATGDLAITRLPVGASPRPDEQRDANQAALNALTEIDGPGFSVWVDPEQKTSHHGDAWLTWSNSITLGVRVPGEPEGQAWAHVEPMGSDTWIPLEIGYTDASRTFLHLAQGTGVARWAYGSEHVVLMVPRKFVRDVEPSNVAAPSSPSSYVTK